MGGEAEHTLTVAEMPAHTHKPIESDSGVGVDWSQIDSISVFQLTNLQQHPDTKGRTVYTSSTGGSQPHNNMPPYFVGNYWKRVA